MGTEKRDAYTLAVAAQLRAEIAAAGLSVVGAAKKSGVPRGTLVRYLDGTREIPVSVMYRLALALGVDVPTLIERADDRFGTSALSEADYTLAARDDDDDAEAEAQQEEA